MFYPIIHYSFFENVSFIIPNFHDSVIHCSFAKITRYSLFIIQPQILRNGSLMSYAY